MSKLRISKRYEVLVWVGIAALAFVTIVVPAWVQPIQMWDEAIYVNNAFELAFGGANPLVIQNNCAPSLYNVKPPLAIWASALSARLFGVEEFWFRLPNVLSAFLTCGLVYWSAKRYLGRSVALASVLVLLCSRGYVRGHVTQTADIDGLMVLFTTAYTLLYIDYVVANKRDGPRLALMAALAVLAFYSKSVAGFLMLPGLLIATIVVGRSRLVLADWRAYALGVAGLGLCAGYYPLRESLAPGYWEVVYGSEYLRYVENVMPWHSQPWDFYLEGLYSRNYFPFCFVLLLTPVTYWLSALNERKVVAMLFIASVCFLAVLSYPEVKLEFYDAPAYPLFATLVAATIVKLAESMLADTRVSTAVAFAVVAGLAFWPASEIIERGWVPTVADPLMADGIAIKQFRKSHPSVLRYTILHCPAHYSHVDQAMFYAKAYNATQGTEIALVYDASQLQEGDIFLCAQPASVGYAEALFVLEELREFAGTTLYRATEWRNPGMSIGGDWVTLPAGDCLRR